MNRLEGLDFGKNPSVNIRLILTRLTPARIVPKVNKYYTFIYKAKTPGVQYDQNPLIQCGDVYQWGFNGYNVHWNAIRKYSWNEVRSNLFELSDEEFSTLQDVPLALFKTA